MVAMYAVEERSLDYHGEAHNSWVSRLAFDTYAQLPAISSDGAAAGAAALGNGAALMHHRPLQRLGSVGQDGYLCLWDVLLPPESELPPFMPPGQPLRKIQSSGSMATAEGAQRQPAATRTQSSAQQPAAAARAPDAGLLPRPARGDLNIIQPVQQCLIHLEPLSDVVFLDSCLLTADHTGRIKLWQRPTS